MLGQSSQVQEQVVQLQIHLLTNCQLRNTKDSAASKLRRGTAEQRNPKNSGVQFRIRLQAQPKDLHSAKKASKDDCVTHQKVHIYENKRNCLQLGLPNDLMLRPCSSVYPRVCCQQTPAPASFNAICDCNQFWRSSSIPLPIRL